MKKLAFITFYIFFILSSISCVNHNIQTPEDKILLTLMNKRLEVAPLVAKSKWNTKTPIDDPGREKIILDSVQAKAHKLGVNEDLARSFFQAQFEAGKIIQRKLHEKWKIQNQPAFDPAPDLATKVRPVLDSLTPLLLIELRKMKIGASHNQSMKKLSSDARKMINPSFDSQVVKTAIKPLESYFKK